MNTKTKKRNKIKKRIRKVVFGTSERPRMTVFRSNKAIYAQIINDKEENDWIFKNFEQISTGSSEGLGVMIGITDGEEEGTWKWISGEEVTYSNWGTNQPDNSRGLENHSVIGWDRGTWNDIQEDWNNLQTITKWGEVKGLVEVSICNQENNLREVQMYLRA